LRFEELQDLTDLFGEPELGPAVYALQEELKSVEFTKWKTLIQKKRAELQDALSDNHSV